MSAEAHTLSCAGCSEPSADRSNRNNGYRDWYFATRVGTIEVAIPELRAVSYFRDWLLKRRQRCARALIILVATVSAGGSARRVERLVECLSVNTKSRSV